MLLRVGAVFGVYSLLAVSAFAGVARGHFAVGWYSHTNSDSDCTSSSRVDPVGAVFYRTINTTVGTAIEDATGWSNQSDPLRGS